MKPFTTAGFVILVVAGLAHAIRLIAGFDVLIAGQAVPRWVSAIAALIAFLVAYQMRKEAKA